MSVQRQIDQLVALRAAQWYEEWRTGELADEHALKTWLAESPKHMDAFLSIAAQDLVLREACRERVIDIALPVAADTATNVHSLPQVTTGSQAQPLASDSSPARPWRWYAVSAAAVLLALVITFGRAYLDWSQYDTPVGEQRVIRLADGSVVKLNAQSTLRVRFDDSRRELLLTGEALFNVARDASRPFRVHTETAVVQAVGTEFNVYARADGRVTVSVLEGHVNVSRDAGPTLRRFPAVLGPRAVSTAATSLPLTAGEQVHVIATGEFVRPAKPDVETAVIWQQRKLVFKYTPLEDIAAEFNRYNSAKLRLENVPPEKFRYTGVFDADDPEELALVLSTEPDLEVIRREREIVIRGRDFPQGR